jgi:hypothetical protein
MATAPGSQATPAKEVVSPEQREIRVYSHSSLFYWWPVWAVGFLMGFITIIDGGHMAVVPKNAIVERDREVVGHDGKHDVIILPAGAKLQAKSANDAEPAPPKLYMAHSSKLGVIFCTVLLLIIVVSNVPLRGLWSVMIVLFVVLLMVIFALADWWGWIVEKVSLLDIRINAGGYFFIATILFIIWAVTVFIFDHRTYLAVTPGQIRMCMAIGAGETVYDTAGMTFSKRQDDLFRHWIVGMGSGDLIIHRSNTQQEIDLPNVLFIGAKIKEIERLVKEKVVV